MPRSQRARTRADPSRPRTAPVRTSEPAQHGAPPLPPALPPTPGPVPPPVLPSFSFIIWAPALRQALRPTEQKCSFAVKKRPGRKDAKAGPQAMMLGRKRASREEEAPGGRASPGPGRCLRKRRRC